MYFQREVYLFFRRFFGVVLINWSIRVTPPPKAATPAPAPTNLKLSSCHAALFVWAYCFSYFATSQPFSQPYTKYRQALNFQQHVCSYCRLYRTLCNVRTTHPLTARTIWSIKRCTALRLFSGCLLRFGLLGD